MSAGKSAWLIALLPEAICQHASQPVQVILIAYSQFLHFVGLKIVAATVGKCLIVFFLVCFFFPPTHLRIIKKDFPRAAKISITMLGSRASTRHVSVAAVLQHGVRGVRLLERERWNNIPSLHRHLMNHSVSRRAQTAAGLTRGVSALLASNRGSLLGRSCHGRKLVRA